MAEPKRLDIAKFRELGYLHEVNRLVLHPLGLALEVVVEDDETERLGGVWDYREDPEGMLYGDDLLSAEKAHAIAERWIARRGERVRATGAMVQPVQGPPKLTVISIVSDAPSPAVGYDDLPPRNRLCERCGHTSAEHQVAAPRTCNHTAWAGLIGCGCEGFAPAEETVGERAARIMEEEGIPKGADPAQIIERYEAEQRALCGAVEQAIAKLRDDPRNQEPRLVADMLERALPEHRGER